MKNQVCTQRGVALIEALIAMLIIAFGTLGFIGLQARTKVANLEAYQRSQALILVNDMAERISLNRASAASYVSDDIGATPPSNCNDTSLSPAQKDLCEWANAIRGAGEKQGSTLVGAMLNARGCITNPSANFYQISIAWQGIQATRAPIDLCGKNNFSSEDMRRTVSVVVQIGSLLVITPTPPASTP
ncbi:type IV pilus modification protein PilV [Acidovorax carolinensis]|nr:type IV pilus modification protein PilV [Acidovorax carolinensis]